MSGLLGRLLSVLSGDWGRGPPCDTPASGGGSIALLSGGAFLLVVAVLVVAVLGGVVVAVVGHLFGARVLGVLGVLLVLGVEVVDGVLHDVARVHRLLQRGRDALQGHRAPVPGRGTRTVDAVRESKAQGHGSQEHFQTDEEVLPASRHSANANFVLSILRVEGADHLTLLQDSQYHTCTKTNLMRIEVFVITNETKQTLCILVCINQLGRRQNTHIHDCMKNPPPCFGSGGSWSYTFDVALCSTLPEGEEDDRLDDAELEHWVVCTEEFMCSEVEEKESVESQADGDVVDDGDVQVATVWPVKVDKVKQSQKQASNYQLAAYFIYQSLKPQSECTGNIKSALISQCKNSP